MDLFASDRPLVEAAARAGLDQAALSACVRHHGPAGTAELGRVANEVRLAAHRRQSSRVLPSK